MIKFHHEEDKEEEKLTFDMVDVNQFFVADEGRIYQKCHATKANKLTNGHGIPFSDSDYFEPEKEIEKILPHVTKITWE